MTFTEPFPGLDAPKKAAVWLERLAIAAGKNREKAMRLARPLISNLNSKERTIVMMSIESLLDDEPDASAVH